MFTLEFQAWVGEGGGEGEGGGPEIVYYDVIMIIF